MHDLGLDPEDASTFVLIADGKAYVKSDAAIRLSRYFRRAWKPLGIIKIIPRQLETGPTTWSRERDIVGSGASIRAWCQLQSSRQGSSKNSEMPRLRI